MELGGHRGSWIHKISCQTYIKLLILFQSVCCIYFKLPWEYQRGHSCSMVGEWDGISRKPISLCAGSTPNSFIMPFWLRSGLTLFQHSESSGHSPRLLDRFVAASWKALVISLHNQQDVAVSKLPLGPSPLCQDGEMPVWTSGSGVSWMCLFPSALSKNASKAVVTTKKMRKKISHYPEDKVIRGETGILDAPITDPRHSDYLWPELLTVLLPTVLFLRSHCHADTRLGVLKYKTLQWRPSRIDSIPDGKTDKVSQYSEWETGFAK